MSVKLRTGDDRVLGEIMGEELNENVILHRDDAGTLCEIEDIGSASKVFDLERLEVEGLPVNVSLAKAGQQESKAG